MDDYMKDKVWINGHFLPFGNPRKNDCWRQECASGNCACAMRAIAVLPAYTAFSLHRNICGHDA